MVATNYVVNMANYVRNRQLVHQVHRSKQRIQQLQTNIYTLETTVGALNTDVAVQRSISNRFKVSLDATRSLLEVTIHTVRSFEFRIIL